MINPKELRIGNWVAKTEIKFSGLRETEYQIRNGMDIVQAGIYNPIPLTTDILEKCGFEKGDYHKNWFHGPILTPHIIMYDDGFILEVVDDIRISESFSYLHQLQNLYFALTKKELNYKP